MSEENIICPICNGRGIINEEQECTNIDCNEGLLKDKEEVINELLKEKDVSSKQIFEKQIA